MTLTDEQIEDLRRRASIVSGMLQMGEPVSFGSDSGMIDELLSALEAEKKRADEAEAEIERLLMRDDPVFAYSFMKRAHKSETELTRLREEIEQYREAARGQVVIVNTASSRIKELEAEVARLRGVVEEADITLSHARTFVTTREKMHPTGVSLYDALLARISALKGAPQ